MKKILIIRKIVFLGLKPHCFDLDKSIKVCYHIDRK